MMRDNAGTLIGQVKERREPFTRSDIEALTMPLLLLAGDRTPEAYPRILDGIQIVRPDARHGVIPNASHISSIDNPAAFARTVLAFLLDQPENRS